MTRLRLVSILRFPEGGFARGSRGPAAFAEAALGEVERGADELALVEPWGSDRQTFLLSLERVAAAVRVPVLALATLTRVDELRTLVEAGADRVGPGRGVVATPSLLEACAGLLGAARLVAEFATRRVGFDGSGERRTPAWARERPELRVTAGGHEVLGPEGKGTGLAAAAWAAEAIRRGAGELLVAGSVDAIRSVRHAVAAPLAASPEGADETELRHLLTAGADALHLPASAGAPRLLHRALAFPGVPA